jgi:hypothetical protein
VPDRPGRCHGRRCPTSSLSDKNTQTTTTPSPSVLVLLIVLFRRHVANMLGFIRNDTTSTRHLRSQSGLMSPTWSVSCRRHGGYGARLHGPKSNGVNDGRTAVLYRFSTYDKLKEMRQSATTHKNRQKHRNHGGQAALHSSDVELMDQRDPSCERPVHVGRGRGRRINIENPKI